MDDSEFRLELSQMVMMRAAAGNLVDTLAFVAEVSDRLQEDPVFGEVTLADDTRQLSTGRLAKLHGFTEFDDSDQTLSMVVGKWAEEDQQRSISTSEIEEMRGWLEGFADAALRGKLASDITESSPAYQLATTLYDVREKVSCIRLHILSNQMLSKGYRRESRSTIAGVHAETHIWDLKRIHALYSSGREREVVEINLLDFGSYGIPCIEASKTENSRSYLCVIDGDVLANLFDRYGSRLLEGNVRSFLGMKGGVNRGIRTTIQDKPGLFFAYNNGIAATAAGAGIENTKDGPRITSLSDLQIVNGGQTTASILRARKQDRLQLSGVAVPMKLTIVSSGAADGLVPKIAEYANTQNKVAIADFFANHP
ncbi:MAG: AIPR family protein, partial [Burkholderia sp.]|nr:AIPR family protein [Burkholderia sp.]